MSQRTIKNYTDTDYILSDLGDIVIPANGAVDLGGTEERLIELASSESLLDALSQGTDKFQVNDGLKDLDFSNGIDLIRKIQRPTEVDELGRWVVRADSRKNGWDVVFQGAGDDTVNQIAGNGIPFLFDFSAADDDLRWANDIAPTGYKMQIIDWQFCDWTYIKEGTIYYYDMPKGSYINFHVLAPPGTTILKKSVDENLQIVREYLVDNDNWTTFLHWVIDYHMEGSAPMGDELNTESAAERPSPSFFVWRAEICVPDVTDYQLAHGHWSLEIYRESMGQSGPRIASPSKMVTWPPA